ncbi:1-(5-phosphoribosyl)-5-[(5-phosphoribosylamino)methylideneamino] imidazole-4-carboxamide isomerase [Echinicola jeungdonensis]|uniref:1-(5-phosphoribosyl)-5-[(5-phosphoribosylamino)methylideneamino] imidazole-4-carboxamide isomerase n=1 Tax=Echinicola jeungdonensis TaxID=709343 RepID=A0ABV5J8B2_9BACT|nr:1-(5-phosphoribosyl)-5-[(5-phosphoribosylamino)methylideneamino] imidazole-4-carboxamide isomerase [Echinicola jeungdonensis]MDN3669226.1 1-(5-phosphoribosyl)-5-[(5-phosphoribosylamino)methylideneamino] imidazole-4-carboxamide isomerase [Echinicola jeungdonensis]
MFEIIPSIWILNGKCVRLRRGDFNTEELISNNPLEIAQEFENCGIQRVHLVDLDGAKRGEPKNYYMLRTIAAYTSLKVDFTGGVSTDGDVMKVFEHGAKTITASTVAVRSPEKFTQWIISYGREKINMAADTEPSDFKVKIRGWLKNANIDLFDHISYFYERGLKYVKCSDVSRDGVMEGPNFELYKKIRDRFPDLCLVASGGVRTIDDFRKLKDLGLKGAVFGKAYYEEKIKIKDLEAFIKEC